MINTNCKTAVKEMSIKFITNPNDELLKKWEQFVLEHPNGNIFQTPFMYTVYKSASGYDPLVILMVDEQHNVLGVFLSVIQTFAKGIAKYLSSRAFIWGGPLVSDNNKFLFKKIITEYEKIIKNRAIYTEIRNIFDQSHHRNIFKDVYFEYEDHLNIIIDLSKSKEQLWQEVHQKRRNRIRRAYKEGTQFSSEIGTEQLEECYNILSEVYTRAKLPLPEKKLFFSAVENSNKYSGLKVFAALNNAKIIGTIFALYFKNILYDWYAGSYSYYYKKYPNDLIPWEVFLWAKENDYKIFDFGGAGKPKIPYGVRDYKKKFGGELVNYGRFKKVHQPIKMKFAEFGFKAWQRIRN